MRTTRLLLAAMMLAPAAPLAAWEDGFGLASVSGFIQAWNLARPDGGSPAPAGALDDSGRGAGGWRADGLYLRRLEVNLGVGLGLPGASLRVGVQNDLGKASVGDAYVAWNPPLLGLSLRAGQTRLPFGLEQQTGSASLPTLDRALIFGYSNYGHVDAWGLGLLSERGAGLRVDYSPGLPAPSGEPDLRLTLQAGAFYARAQGFDSVLGGGGRAQLRWGLPELHVQAGASLFAGRGRAGWQATNYRPLGRRDWVAVEGLGRPTLLTWGADASVVAHPFHLQAELALQRVGSLERGGGAVTGWIELPILPQGWDLYARVEQASPGWADGVRAPGALLRGRILGLRARLPWRQSLTSEWKEVEGDGLESAFGGALWAAQWQAEF